MFSNKILAHLFFLSMSTQYILIFSIAIFLSWCLTKIVVKLAKKWQILDYPSENRKIHKKPIPLLGGTAIYLSFLILTGICWFVGFFNDGVISGKQIIGILLGGFVLMIVGFLDDKYDLKSKSFVGPLLAVVIAIAFGIGIKYITNPFISGTGPYGRALFYFDWINIGGIAFLGMLFSFLWILGMIYTTKFLDGLDGLASGIGGIGALILFFVSLFWDVPQSGTSVLSLIFAGACFGFLIWNWHPAKIFLGEGGSVFIGFMLGVLAIISGGKIATALLIMGIPILDVAWVILRRIFFNNSALGADKKHLHFRLLNIGLSQRQVVFILYFFSTIFGVSSLFLQSQSKVIALGILFLVMILLATILVIKTKKSNV